MEKGRLNGFHDLRIVFNAFNAAESRSIEKYTQLKYSASKNACM